MSSASSLFSQPEPEPQLSTEEWWQLFETVRLRMIPAYEELGGAVAFFRRERDADDDL